MKIEILGTGCAKCSQLAANAEAAAKELGVDFELKKVTSLSEISSYGVMVTPALAVNGEVKIAGKVPSPAQIKDLLQTPEGD